MVQILNKLSAPIIWWHRRLIHEIKGQVSFPFHLLFPCSSFHHVKDVHGLRSIISGISTDWTLLPCPSDVVRCTIPPYPYTDPAKWTSIWGVYLYFKTDGVQQKQKSAISMQVANKCHLLVSQAIYFSPGASVNSISVLFSERRIN